MESGNALFLRQRLRLRKHEEEGQAALLDVENHAGVYQACCCKTRHSTKGLPYSSSQLRDTVEAERKQPQGCSRFAETCVISDHSIC